MTHHATERAQYEEDRARHADPWRRWQFEVEPYGWRGCEREPQWQPNVKYRRRPEVESQ